jgi:bifunctional non-homologous end joining protein LigD
VNSKTLVKVKGRILRLSNLDKVLYPRVRFTKAQVLDYYHRISPVLLPHLRDRPLTLKRYPEGVEGEFFYEKQCPPHPAWVPTQGVPGERRTVHYCVVNDEPTLIWVANLASLELHVLLSTARDLDRPTAVAFDFDPGPGCDILDCARLALEVRDLLKRIKLKSWAKTSGGKGLHLYVPLNSAARFADTKNFARAVAQTMEKEFPERVVSKAAKELRRGKVFIDWSQNDEHKTTVCAYSLRAQERPTVSMPVTWAETERAVAKKSVAALAFDSDAALKRVARRGDAFAEVLKLKQKLPR